MTVPGATHPRRGALRAAWRGQIRPAWREAKPLIGAAATVSVFVLGTLGFRNLAARAGHPESVLDALYQSLGLFEVNPGEVRPPVPLELNVARFLAPALVGYAVVKGLLALFGEHLKLLRIRALARHHVVVAGLGGRGLALALAFEREGFSVIAVDPSVGGEALTACRDRGIAVLRGDASKPGTLAQARINRARHLIATCGSDGINVEVAVAAIAAAQTRRRGVLSALIHLDDAGLWRMLKAEAVSGLGHGPVRIEFFNVYDLAARALLATHPAFAPASTSNSKRSPHVMLVGADGLADALIRDLARRWQNSRPGTEEHLRLTLVDERAADYLRRLRARYPELSNIGCLSAIEVPLGVELQRSAVLDLGPRQAVTAVYVCLEEEAKALEVTLALQARTEIQSVPLVVAVDHARTGLALILQRDSPTGQRALSFGVLDRALDVVGLLRGTSEELARAKHDEYVRHQLLRGGTMGEGLLVAWEDLHEDWKEANRAFADGIAAKLEAAGCVVVPAPLIDPDLQPFSFAEEEVEELARLEHDRWVQDKIRSGWRYGEPRNDARKLHPLLIDWAQLPEPERDKDREPVRELPRMLAQAGFEICRAGSAATRGARPATASPAEGVGG